MKQAITGSAPSKGRVEPHAGGIAVEELEGRLVHDTVENDLLLVTGTSRTSVKVRDVGDEQTDTVPVYGGHGLRSGRYIVKDL